MKNWKWQQDISVHTAVREMGICLRFNLYSVLSTRAVGITNKYYERRHWGIYNLVGVFRREADYEYDHQIYINAIFRRHYWLYHQRHSHQDAVPVPEDRLSGTLEGSFYPRSHSPAKGPHCTFHWGLAGVPLKDVDTIDLDARMEQIQRAGSEEKDFVESFGHLSATVFSERRAWASERFLELYLWCVSGAYGKVIQAHT